MSLKQIIDQVVQQHGDLPSAQVRDLVKATLVALRETIESAPAGSPVKVAGLGTFRAHSPDTASGATAETRYSYRPSRAVAPEGRRPDPTKVAERQAARQAERTSRQIERSMRRGNVTGPSDS